MKSRPKLNAAADHCRTGSKSYAQRKKRPSQRFDYMQAPPSMATPLKPIFPWEQEEDIKERSASRSVHRNRHRQALCYRQYCLGLVVLFVSLALTAGLLDGDNPHKQAKQRGQYLPAAKSKQGGIAKDMYQVYQSIKEDYHTKTFKNADQNQWKVLIERDGAKVSLLEHPSDPTCPYVRMETIIPTSVGHCWEFLQIYNWDWSMPKMDPFYDSHSVFSNYTHHGVNMILVQKKTHRILAFGKRDFVFLSVSDHPLSDGTYVSGSVSVETPDVPRETQYTRAFQDSVAFYKPVIHYETGEEQCHLTIVCRIDLNDSAAQGSGGFVPMWLYVKTVGATGIKSVLKMKGALMEMKKEHQEAVEEANVQESVDQTPTAAFPASSATPPTPSPGTIINQDVPSYRPILAATTQVSKAATALKWWNRPRGGAGAFLPKPTIPKLEPPAAIQRWKPLYQVFTFPPKRERSANRGRGGGGGGGGGAKWLQHIPRLVGKGKLGTP